jgi:membrane protein DedA with SNARE-associated domain
MPALDHIVLLLTHYGYLLLFPIAIIEGPIISIIGGFLISTKVLNPFITYPVLVMGDVVGDTLYYLLGRLGGERLVLRWGHWVGITPSSLKKAENTLHKHGAKLYLFGKVQGLGSLILIAAGITKMPFPRYIWINTMITFVKTFILVLIGYYFGYAYATIDGYLNRIGIICSFVIVAVLISYYFNRSKQKI